METKWLLMLVALLVGAAGYAQAEPSKADCARDYATCNSERCNKALRQPQLTPCPGDPKCRCEAACERASVPVCKRYRRCDEIAEQLAACLAAPPASGDPCRNIRLKNQRCARGEDPDAS